MSWATMCGATFRSRTGQIQSPNFPNNFGNLMSCDYIISTPGPGTFFVVLTFEVVSLEGNNTSCSDYVEISELKTGVILRKLCGFVNPSPLRTNGPMKIAFRSNGVVTHKGFLASYVVSDGGGDITLDPSLEGRWLSGKRYNSVNLSVIKHLEIWASTTDDEGFKKYASDYHESAVIRPITFPANYHNNMNCIWKIIAPENMTLSFKFSTLSLEDYNCKYDFVEIRDGHSENSTLISRNCGNVTPNKSFKSTGNRMLIRMYTDDFGIYGVGFVGDVMASEM